MTKVRYAIPGGGNRGAGYADWITRHADRASVTAVVEPRALQREQLATRHGAERVFESWADFAAAPRLADAAIVATPDAEHAGPAIALARKGYHLLVEKPLAPTEQECVELVDAVAEAGVLFAVCHVLRYRPYTRLVKQLIDDGRLGEIRERACERTIDTGRPRAAPPSLRGGVVKRAAPGTGGALALRALVRARQLAAQHHFRRENQPPDATDRCVSCAVEPDCPSRQPLAGSVLPQYLIVRSASSAHRRPGSTSTWCGLAGRAGR